MMMLSIATHVHRALAEKRVVELSLQKVVNEMALMELDGALEGGRPQQVKDSNEVGDERGDEPDGLEGLTKAELLTKFRCLHKEKGTPSGSRGIPFAAIASKKVKLKGLSINSHGGPPRLSLASCSVDQIKALIMLLMESPEKLELERLPPSGSGSDFDSSDSDSDLDSSEGGSASESEQTTGREAA